MMTSLYTGVSGMLANQTYLDVISNNVSNANTVAYKSESVTFDEVLNQTISEASAPDASGSYGGTNPMQYGLGVGIASITTSTESGSLQSTGNATDIAIDGEGYFIVSDSSGVTYYTRSGNFGIDEDGNLVTADGLLVNGWADYTTDDEGNYIYSTSDELLPVNLYADNKETLEPTATTEINLTGNLNSSEDANTDSTALDDIGTVPDEFQHTVSITAYDDLGNEFEVDLNLTKCYVDTTTNETSWYYEIESSDSTVSLSPSSGYIKFDEDGTIVTDETDFEASPTITLSASDSGTNDIDFTIDMSAMSMYNTDSTAYVLTSDGNSASELVDFSIGQDGIITGIYDNGESKPLGCIGLASFSNAAGLEKIGSSLYQATANSGLSTTSYQPGTEGMGALSVGYLEMSNVDLSTEFSNMIVAQRAYQASSKVITTADEMLQTLINLK